MNLQELREKRAKQKNEGERGVLPSGLEVVLRPIKMIDFVMQGEIPQDLFPAIEKQMNGGKAPNTVAEIRQYGRLAKVVALAAIKEPEGVTEDDLDADDAMFVFNLVSAGTQEMWSRFRQEQTRVVESSPSSDGVLTEAIVIPGA